MPKIINPDKRQQMKLDILKLLSVDGRASIQDMAKKLGVPKTTAYNLFLEVEKEYGLKFVPEININQIWKYELVKLSREGSKREILSKTIDKMHDIGFEEYVIFIKFMDNIPEEKEIKKILELSYMPQFAAIVRGQYDLIIYAISRSYKDIDSLIISLGNQLKSYNFKAEVNRIERTFGYFPVRSELIKQFAISENYKNLMINLNENGRTEIKKIEETNSSKSLSYNLEKLKKTGILSRITYFETKSKNVITSVIRFSVINYDQFLNSKIRWFSELVNSGKHSHNEYTLMCDISNPQGCLIFCNFENNQNAELFFTQLKNNIKGAKFEFINIAKTIFGNEGIRNFDNTCTDQKRELDRLKYKSN